MDNETTPDAQGQTPAEPVSNAVAAPQVQANPNEGIEKRIGELTAARRLAEERAAAQEAQIAELIRALTETRNVPQAPAPQEPQLPDLDPELKTGIEAIASHKVRSLEEKINQLMQLQRQQELQQVMSRAPDPEVSKEAQRLYQSWQRAGYSGFVAEDALIYAMGQRALQERKASAQARDEKGRFNSMSQSVMTGQSAPQSMQPQQGLPRNFEQLPLDKQIELMEQQLGDKPLF